MCIRDRSNSLAGENITTQGKFTLRGYVRDALNGEMLVGVTVYCPEIKTGAVTNVYGFYSLSLAPGKYALRYSYIGFNPVEKEINLDKNITLDINLQPVESVLSLIHI